MRFAPDQPHQTTAVFTEERFRSNDVFKFDLFHDPEANARVTSVNSVSLQPTFVPTTPFGQTTHLPPT